MPTLYVIEAVGAGIIKIGFTRVDPHDRMASLRNGSPFRLRLVHTEIIDDDIDVRRLEKYVHGLLHSQRMQGEWFSATLDQAKIAIAKAYENRVCKPMSAPRKFPAYKATKRPTRYL